MNTAHRKPLAGTALDYFDARAAVEALTPGAWDGLPYTSRVLAENLVRRCDPATLDDSLRQLIERRRDLDFPWFPARVVCHDILGQTALVDLAGLRDAIADQGGDPAQVNPVVPVQLIVDHSLAVECGGFDPDAFAKNRAIEDRRNEDRFHFIDWTKRAFRNVDVIPPGNGIMHQINLERMSPVIGVQDGVAYPDTCVGTDSHTPHVDALGVIAIGVGGLEAENVMLGRASWMRLPDIIGVELAGKPQPGITATDIVLSLTEFLRKQKVVGAYLEFRGEGAAALTLGDRATISNMAPEYGATAAMFFIDQNTLDYLRLTGRSDAQVALVETYARTAGLWADALAGAHYERTLHFDLSTRGAHDGRPIQPACTRRHQRSGRQGHRQSLERNPGADARWRGDHRGDHFLHQHLESAQCDRRRPAGAQRAQRGSGAQALGQVLAGAGLQGGRAVPGRSWPEARSGSARLRHRRLRLHHLQRHVRRARPEDPAGKSSSATSTPPPCCPATATSTAASTPTPSRPSSPRRRWWSPTPSPAPSASTSRRTRSATAPTARRCC